MQKIPSLFMRNYETDRLVRNEIVEGTEWVINGEGIATRKYDGTCCMVKDGKLYKRREVKKGKPDPAGFIAAQESDPITGKRVGWVLVTNTSDTKYYMEAFNYSHNLLDGTYELVGPKIQGNPEKASHHMLIAHIEIEELFNCPRDFEGIKTYLIGKDIEGIVWHHPDGKMVKIKKKDFGLKRCD